MARGLARMDIYLRILEIAHHNPGDASLPYIRKALGMTPQRLNYYIRRLEAEGLIEVVRSYPRFIRVTPKGKKALLKGELKGSSEGQSGTPRARVHALQILIPILRRGDDIDGKEIKMKGWARKVLDIDIPDVTVEDTGKHIRLYVHDIIIPRSKAGMMQITQIITRILYVINAYFTKRGWVLDIFHHRVVNQHIENPAGEYHDAAEGEVTVSLGRKARDIVKGGEMEQEAKAWLDKSPGILSIESNDRLYEEKLILMPEKVDNIEKLVKVLALDTTPLLKQLHDDLTMHLEAVQQIALSQTTLNKLLHRMNLLLERLEKHLEG